MTAAPGWDREAGPDNADGHSFVVDIDGFEGPLDLLLHLARRQRVDLSRISVLALADQYLRFIEEMRSLRLEIAADTLVMAAWLTFLKSKLLMPKQPHAEPGESGEEMAAVLQFRLRRLEAMREAGARLMAASQLGRDVFARGMPEPVAQDEGRAAYSASLHDLLSAYAQQRRRRGAPAMTVAERDVCSLAEARQLLEEVVSTIGGWTALQSISSGRLKRAAQRSSALASAFAASLELAREGRMEIRQSDAFAPLLLRMRPALESLPDPLP